MLTEPVVLVQSPAVVQPPEMSLFMGVDPPYDPRRATAECDGLRSALDSLGIRTIAPCDVLADIPRDTLVGLALTAIRADDEERLLIARTALEQWSSWDLIPIVVRQPGLVLEADRELAEISPDHAYENYILRPLFGLMFPRDHYVDLGGEVAVGRLRRSDRVRETAVMDAVLQHLRGRPAELKITAPHHMEGGDLVAYGDVAVLNVGFRTSEAVFEILQPHLESQFQHVLRVRDRLRRPGQFHLDHWLALGPRVALAATDRLDDVVVVGGRTYGATRESEGVTLRQVFDVLDIAVIELDAGEVDAFAANVFFIPSRTAVVVSTACAPFMERTLERRGIDVVPIPFDEHHKQFGSIHCAVNTICRPTEPMRRHGIPA